MATHVSPPIQIPRNLLDELTKLGPLLDAASRAHALGADIFTNHIHQKRLDTDFQVVAYIIFTKGFKTFQSATNLCRCGCGSDALSLCASLFENYIDLQYIANAPVRRARRYIQYEGVEKYYHLQNILAKKRLPKGVRKIYRGYEAKVASRAAKLLRYFGIRGRGWSQKSIFERARRVGAEMEYQELYWMFCLPSSFLDCDEAPLHSSYILSILVTPQEGDQSMPRTVISNRDMAQALRRSTASDNSKIEFGEDRRLANRKRRETKDVLPSSIALP